MTRTVVALFDDFSAANHAVRDLVEAGFMRENVSLMASDAEGNYGRYLTHHGENVSTTDATTGAATGASEGAGVGAGIGAVIGGLGGLLVGLGALTIPGIGPVLAAGPLSAALTGLAGAGVGAVAGGVTGGILGALVDMGIPEDTAGLYAEGIRRGGTLVTLRSSDEMTQKAVDILNRHHPIDINQRATQWRESGWTGYNPSTSADDYVRDRLDTPAAHDTDLSSTSLGDIGHNQEQKLWPREGYRESEQRTGHEVERSLWSEEDSMSHAAGSDFSDFSEFDDRFRTHFNTSYTGMGYTYDEFQPAYRYGYTLARDHRYRDYDWDRLEPEARRTWEHDYPHDDWERFKMSIRHAWEEIKDAVD